MNPLQREKLARVYGHLEGYAAYADFLDLFPSEQDKLSAALREDAQALSELLDELSGVQS